MDENFNNIFVDNFKNILIFYLKEKSITKATNSIKNKVKRKIIKYFR